MKKPRKRRTQMLATSLRLPPSILERAEWKAKETGRSSAEVMRNALEEALRNQRPPKSADFEGFDPPAAEIADWKEGAEHLGVTLNEYLRQAANYASKRLKGTAPSNNST